MNQEDWRGADTMPKFVKWVPTPDVFIESFFELALVSASDTVYDLGSGDGRLLFAALERGAGKCVGIDLDTECVATSRETAKNKGLDARITFIEGDMMAQDLSPASVVLAYLFGSGCAALRPKLEQELKTGTRVVMEMYPVPGWKPATTRETHGRSFYLYVMPPEKTEDYDSAIIETAYEYDWFYWP